MLRTSVLKCLLKQPVRTTNTFRIVRPFSRNVGKESTASGGKKKTAGSSGDVNEAIKDGAKFVTGTFVTALAENVAFYIVIAGALGVGAYFFPYQSVYGKMKLKYDAYKEDKKKKIEDMVEEKRMQLSDKLENAEKAAVDLRNNEKVQSALDKGNDLKNSAAAKLQSVDMAEMKGKLESKLEHASEIIKGNNAGEKLDEWKNKALEKVHSVDLKQKMEDSVEKGKQKASEVSSQLNEKAKEVSESAGGATAAREKFSSFKNKWMGNKQDKNENGGSVDK
jgi:hypothetical protein